MHKSYLRFMLLKIAKKSCRSRRKFSQDVVSNEAIKPNLSKKKSKGNISLTKLCSPPLDLNQSQEISSFVAINLRIDSISWAKMCKDGNDLTDWNIHNLPPNITKSDPIKMHHLVQSVYKKLPKADLYVTDQLKTRGGSKNPAASAAFITKLQLLSMLISMINFPCSDSREQAAEEENSVYSSKVVLLRPLLVMQLFNLLVGGETISVKPVIEKVLKNELSGTHRPLKINVDASLSYNLSKTIVDKENMGLALLMSITFMELIIHRNPDSFKILMTNLDR